MRRFSTLWDETFWGLLAAPRRLIGSGLAASLGIGLFLAVGTLSQAGRLEVSDSFDVLASTEVRVVGRSALITETAASEAIERLEASPAIAAADLVIDYGDAPLSDGRPGGITLGAPVFGAAGGSLEALATQIYGRPLPHEGTSGETAMALVGRALLNDLDIREIDGVRTITVGPGRFVIVGIIEQSARRELLDAVVIPRQLSSAAGVSAVEEEIVLRVVPGAAAAVAKQVPLMLLPNEPDELIASAPPDPDQFRRGVERDVELALIAVSAVAVVVGALSMANSLAVSVLSRTAELGLRRALGATTVDIFTLVMFEGVLIGLFGGVAGASAGLCGAFMASAALGWIRLVDPVLIGLGIGGGAALGVLASLPTAIRASRLNPADALRVM